MPGGRSMPCALEPDLGAGHGGSAAAVNVVRTLSAAWVFALTLTSFALSLPVPLLAQDDPSPRIAYVDMKRLLDNAPQIAQSRERMSLAFRARSAELDSQKARLAELEQRIEAESLQAPIRQLSALQQEADQLSRTIRRVEQVLREDLSERRAAELNRIEQLILDAVVELAREQNIDLVLPGPVIFASPRVDLTDQVLQSLERNARQVSPND